ncbi:MAG: Diaminopimelate epimerase [Bacteroidota bacterium]|jgi:diaminopimelate epimerase
MKFFKYQGTGNDFIIIDDRSKSFNLNKDQIHALCDRRFGIGADGLMLLQDADDYDFRMVYFNSDGTQGTMCGNGGRCLVRFANDLGIIQDSTEFIAVDGPHSAEVFPDKISLKMQDVDSIKDLENAYFANTGSPHYVGFCKDLKSYNVFENGSKIRYSEEFKNQNGTNVNFVEEIGENELFVRTYERGVEDETYSCGTGVTASALIAHHSKNLKSPISIKTIGGNLQVSFEINQKNNYFNIFLIGPAVKVFEGFINL